MFCGEVTMGDLGGVLERIHGKVTQKRTASMSCSRILSLWSRFTGAKL